MQYDSRSLLDPAKNTAAPAIIPAEGQHTLHLYYQVDHAEWQGLSQQARAAARERFTQLVNEVRGQGDIQLVCLAVVTPKADLGFMLMGKDLQEVSAIEKRLTLALGPSVLQPVYSYLSLTERSEYMSSAEEHMATIEREEGLQPGTPEHAERLAAIEARLTKYAKDKLYPNLPDWPVVCFYPMSKTRQPGANWFALPFEERKKLMLGHGMVGRQWAGKIIQLITASTGLDQYEWGVTLFAKNTRDINQIVYQMRFDEVSAVYGEFGEFYIGLQLPAELLLERLQLS